jgi:hypothetical protein
MQRSQRPPAVALLRTSALALAALALTACGQSTAPSASSSSSSPQRPELRPISQSPLRVAGTGFRSGEKVRLVADAPHKQVKHTRADSSGSFRTTFPELSGCGSITITATGSKGSRAEFNFSQIAC